MTRATRLANGESVVTVESGIDVQAMTPAIAKATGAGAAGGVVVSDVSAGAVSSVSAPVAAGAGAAGATNGGASTTTRNGAAHISAGDVITTAADRPVRAPRDWQQILRAQAPGATLKLSIVRFGKPLQASLTLPRNAPSPSGTVASGGAGAGGGAAGAGTPGVASTAGSGAAAGAPASSPLDVMGLTLRSAASGASEVIAVRIGSPAARGGLRAGDRITSMPGRTTSAASASPSAIAIACAELASGQALLLAIDREGASRIAALEKP
jgi:serine protease Do